MGHNTFRFMDDRESFDLIVEGLDGDVKQEYNSYGWRFLLPAFPGRKLVIYTLVGGTPRNIEVVTIDSIDVDTLGGPTAEVAGPSHVGVLTVYPQKFGKRDVFLHIPQKFEFRWKAKYVPSKGIQFGPHYAVMVKTRSKELLQIEGHTYCTTPNDFAERFPKVSLAY